MEFFKNRKVIKWGSIILAVSFVFAMFVGCAEASPKDTAVGKMTLKVNPAFDLYYDAEENTVAIKAVNADGLELLDVPEDYIGRNLADVTKELVKFIGEAGYLESVDGNPIPISISFGPVSENDTNWVPPVSLATKVMDVVADCAEENDWMTAIKVMAAEEVLAEKPTVKEEEEVSEPVEESEPEASEAEPEESSQEAEESKPVESSKPQTQTSTPKPESSTTQQESSENVSVQPEVTEDEDDNSGEILPPEDDGEPNYCSRCGKIAGDGTNGACVWWLKDMTHSKCGEFVPKKTCHTCP